ncbi:M23 family metallopeptidase [Alkalimarinus alittae]|uniref:M23 family metallopeptidase n=1 Tax=Alkalimarinus alittae TaxID=2961619 RepID=A0ABY6MYY4_9ALTE|nr:M23 family metallopeptidase [Alkalimarinus alittae]UZE95056.1 M23 family metallopeptidase [Alkalimarinus alittae]
MRFLANLLFALLLISASSVFAVDAIKPISLIGDKTQGSLIVGQVASGAKVFLDGVPLKVADNGVVVFGFGRDAALDHSLTIVSANGEKHIETITLIKRDYKVQRVNGISKKIMNPNKKNQTRSSSEAKMVRKARATDSTRQDFMAGFIQPVQGPVTGVYGSQRFYNGQPKRPHFGVDYAAPVGTPVIAPASGVVTLAHDDMFYSGGTLLVDHGFGVSSTFMHLSKILVKDGQEIKQGDVIAEVGKSGRATGAHLDWRINWYEHRLDPQLVMNAMPSKVVFK